MLLQPIKDLGRLPQPSFSLDRQPGLIDGTIIEGDTFQELAATERCGLLQRRLVTLQPECIQLRQVGVREHGRVKFNRVVIGQQRPGQLLGKVVERAA